MLAGFLWQNFNLRTFSSSGKFLRVKTCCLESLQNFCLWVLYGAPWCSMVLYGALWCSMVQTAALHCTSLQITAAQCTVQRNQWFPYFNNLHLDVIAGGWKGEDSPLKKWRGGDSPMEKLREEVETLYWRNGEVETLYWRNQDIQNQVFVILT